MRDKEVKERILKVVAGVGMGAHVFNCSIQGAQTEGRAL